MIEFDEDKQKLKLAGLREREEEDFVQSVAAKRGLQYIDLTHLPVNLEALQLIPEAEAKAAYLGVFQLDKKKISVAALDPDEQKTKTALEALTKRGFGITVFLVSHQSLNRLFSFYAQVIPEKETKTGSFDISTEEITKIAKTVHTASDIKASITEVIGKKTGFQTTSVVEVILAGALALKASDIHMEPEEKQVRLRYRLDGVLNDILDFSYETYRYILSRIKLISGLKLNVQTVAQDGRFSIFVNEQEIEIRTSVLPGAYGESIVLRVLNPDAISVPMEELGIEPNLYKILEKELKRPNGMILTTGPTGSGKTTTLYAFLKKVYEPGVKVITIEDPVEYHIKGIVQTQTDPEKGYTFSDGLRAALRQDPDIIMVGEIRDPETAQTAVNAASTGHLVFSTLHTNNAAGTFPRFLGLGVNPKVISSSVTTAMAQRLARKLCTNCRKETVLDGEDKKLVEKVMNGIPISEYKDVPKEKAYTSVGCEKCNMTGYKGRVGLYEAILMSSKIEQVILQNPSEREIKLAAKDQGILTMLEDGVVKVLKGVTSMDEVRRVIDVDSEL